MNNKNEVVKFYIGLILILGSTIWAFFGSFNSSHTVFLIIGIIFIATSKYRFLK